MVFSEHSGEYLKNFSEQWFCVVILSLSIEVGGEIAVALRRVWIVLA